MLHMQRIFLLVLVASWRLANALHAVSVVSPGVHIRSYAVQAGLSDPTVPAHPPPVQANPRATRRKTTAPTRTVTVFRTLAPPGEAVEEGRVAVATFAGGKIVDHHDHNHADTHPHIHILHLDHHHNDGDANVNVHDHHDNDDHDHANVDEHVHDDYYNNDDEYDHKDVDEHFDEHGDGICCGDGNGDEGGWGWVLWGGRGRRSLLATTLVLGLQLLICTVSPVIAVALPGGGGISPTPKPTVTVTVTSGCQAPERTVSASCKTITRNVVASLTTTTITTKVGTTASYKPTTLPATTTVTSEKCVKEVLPKRRLFAYWGQNSGGTQKSLAEYCQDNRYTTIAVGFLSKITFSYAARWLRFGINNADRAGYEIVSVDFPWTNNVPAANQWGMEAVGRDIKICQALGVKIYLSVGGAVSEFFIETGPDGSPGGTPEELGVFLGQTLSSLFFGQDPSVSPAVNLQGMINPYGRDVVFDGLDLDIESQFTTDGEKIVIAAAKEVAKNGASISVLSIHITATPQCPITDGQAGGDVNLGDIMVGLGTELTDINMQFYNNPYCEINKPDFNFQQWAQLFPNAKISVGLPGSSSAAGSGFQASIAALKSICAVIPSVAVVFHLRPFPPCTFPLVLFATSTMRGLLATTLVLWLLGAISAVSAAALPGGGQKQETTTSTTQPPVTVIIYSTVFQTIVVTQPAPVPTATPETTSTLLQSTVVTQPAPSPTTTSSTLVIPSPTTDVGTSSAPFSTSTSTGPASTIVIPIPPQPTTTVSNSIPSTSIATIVPSESTTLTSGSLPTTTTVLPPPPPIPSTTTTANAPTPTPTTTDGRLPSVATCTMITRDVIATGLPYTQTVLSTPGAMLTTSLPPTTTMQSQKCFNTVVPKRRLYGYWGQNSGGTQKSLAEYCKDTRYSTIAVAFLDKITFSYPGKWLTFSLNHANVAGFAIPSVSYPWTNEEPVQWGMAAVGRDIKTCQALGVKIYLSLGGATVEFGEELAEDGTVGGTAEERGLFLGKALSSLFFGRDPALSPAMNLRGMANPYGADVVFDGLDLDIESKFSDDGEKLFIAASKEVAKNGAALSAAPQCFINVGQPGGDANLGNIMLGLGSELKDINIQFYNNPPCNVNEPFTFNYPLWTKMFPAAHIGVGVPGSSWAAGSGFEGSLARLKSTIEGAALTNAGVDPNVFGGVMVWDVNAAESTTDSTSTDKYDAGLRKMLDSL
ncbi:Chitinase 1 [Phlyctochytrium bullatum]|nr:Chitinase 1 [Phlyctochytrium bullatum]